MQNSLAQGQRQRKRLTQTDFTDVNRVSSNNLPTGEGQNSVFVNAANGGDGSQVVSQVDESVDESGRTANSAEEGVQKAFIAHLSLRQPEKLLWKKGRIFSRVIRRMEGPYRSYIIQ